MAWVSVWDIARLFAFIHSPQPATISRMDGGQIVGCVMWDWINDNSGGVQAVGSVAAIIFGVIIFAVQHWLDTMRAKKEKRDERVLHMEAAGAIATNAMNLIQEAWDNVGCKGYYAERFSPVALSQAEAALLEINVYDLPDWEMIRPILGLRYLIGRVPHAMEYAMRAENGDISIDPDEGRETMERIHDEAFRHITNIDAAVNLMRGDF